MNKTTGLILAALLVGFATEAALTAADTDIAKLRARAQKQIGALPDKMPGADQDTPEQIALGKKLYFDTILSLDQTVSCNTCHLVDNNKAGVDNEKVSTGVNKKTGARNSPTVLNAGFHGIQFWDGRAPDLKEQAKGPVLNPVEMAMPDEQTVVDRLSKDKNYPAEFKKAFPDDDEPLSFDNMAGAIAAFERTLVTKDRFDDFLKGDDKALSAQELKGLETFLTVGCVTCHNGPVLGGKNFHKIGVYKPYPNKDDLGRYDATKKNTDKLKFKTPSLRNIAITAPYFHDGGIPTLEEAVENMGFLQTKKGLTDQEKADITAFLKTLTDKPRDPSAK